MHGMPTKNQIGSESPAIMARTAKTSTTPTIQGGWANNGRSIVPGSFTLSFVLWLIQSYATIFLSSGARRYGIGARSLPGPFDIRALRFEPARDIVAFKLNYMLT